MRRAVPLIALLVLAGCGGDAQRENLPRPAPPVTMTAAILRDGIKVSPRAVGAGRVVLIVNNQTDRPQRLTMVTADRAAGNRASTAPIPAGKTGRLTIDARTGTYAVRVSDEEIEDARVVVGPPRESGQNRLLLP